MFTRHFKSDNQGSEVSIQYVHHDINCYQTNREKTKTSSCQKASSRKQNSDVVEIVYKINDGSVLGYIVVFEFRYGFKQAQFKFENMKIPSFHNRENVDSAIVKSEGALCRDALLRKVETASLKSSGTEFSSQRNGCKMRLI